MSAFPQSFDGPLAETPSHSRSSVDGRTSERAGAIPMTMNGPQQRPFPSQQGDPAGAGPMAGLPRSPPKNKNTQHVPCKFFLQGQCQAGRMCPFSHDIESTTRPAPCKYFAKGGCKFGRKCALLHITPDGTVVNRMPPQNFAPPPQGFLQSHGPQYAQPPPGLLSMQAQAMGARSSESEYDNYHYGQRHGHDLHSNMDPNAYASASPQFGSPPQDHRFGASPPSKGLSVLDAPLPNSFDSNGISMFARNGPLAASVPARMGLESPPSSLPRKSQLGNTAIRDLHNSAFGDIGMDGMLASMGSSPPSGTDEPITFPKRSLHSERLRLSRPMVSASLGARLPTQSFEYSDEEEGDTDREEDLLPASLRDLIPEGRLRREERSRAEDDTPAAHLAAQRRTISHHGTPQDSKVGSPSRYSGMFARAQAGKTEFGSPLRNSGLAYASTSSLSRMGNGELSPSLSSPPRQASMSMLTQELQRTKLDAARSQASGVSQPPGPIRTLSNGSSGRRSLDRGPSSTSVGKIDEEPSLFDMDEVGGPARMTPRSIPYDALPSPSNGSNALGTSPNSFGAIGGHRSAK